MEGGGERRESVCVCGGDRESERERNGRGGEDRERI